MSKDTITVYWAPAAFNNELESWNMLYSKPVSISHKIIKNSLPKSSIRSCPAVKGLTNNLFALTSSFEENFKIDTNLAKDVILNSPDDTLIPISGQSKVRLTKARDQELEGYLNYSYNLGWLFFATEPVEVKFTSPYFPPSSPLKDSFIIPGQFDIGKWYRPYGIEYMSPESSSDFYLEENEELIYLEFLTDKKIIFQEYSLSNKLLNLSNECAHSPFNYGKFKTLHERYLMFSKSNMRSKILSEIKKNVIE